MSDKTDIAEVMARYALCVDTHDWAALAALFAEDGVWAFPPAIEARGRDAIAALQADFGKKMPPQMHVITNPVVETEGERASLKACVLVLKLPEAQISAAGRYEVALVKAAGAWLIERLVYNKAGGGGAGDASATRDAGGVAQAYLDALQRQDPAALCALVTDDFVLEVPFGASGRNEPAEAMSWRGIEDYRANYAEYFPTVMTSQRLTDLVVRPTLDGDVVYAEAFGDMSLANGRSYRNRYVFRFELRDGKICRLLEFCNPVTAAIAFDQPLPKTGADRSAAG